jgi:hypothetical protein
MQFLVASLLDQLLCHFFLGVHRQFLDRLAASESRGVDRAVLPPAPGVPPEDAPALLVESRGAVGTGETGRREQAVRWRVGLGLEVVFPTAFLPVDAHYLFQSTFQGGLGLG